VKKKYLKKIDFHAGCKEECVLTNSVSSPHKFKKKRNDFV